MDAREMPRVGTSGLQPDSVAIIDGSFVLHRAMHLPGAEKGPHGTAVGGVEKSLRVLTSLVRKLRPKALFWVHDRAHHPARLALYPDYKKHEVRDDEEAIEHQKYHEAYTNQRDLLLPILARFGAHLVFGPYESDDSIWYLTDVLKKHCVICTEDRDFVQLLGNNVTIYSLHANAIIDVTNWRDFSSWSPREIVMAKAILGDKSDNIPSPCHGLGKVGLRKLFADADPRSLPKLCEAAASRKEKKYSVLLDSDTQAAILRNVQLTMLGLIGFDKAAEVDVVLKAINTPARADIGAIMQFLVAHEMHELADSAGYWARPLEALW